MSQQQEPSTGVRHATETLDLAIKGARVYGREDLVQRLTGARRLLSEPAVTVYVIGEFKQGWTPDMCATRCSRNCSMVARSTSPATRSTSTPSSPTGRAVTVSDSSAAESSPVIRAPTENSALGNRRAAGRQSCSSFPRDAS